MAANQLRRRLQRAENAAVPLPAPATLPAPPPADETGVLAGEIAAAFGRMVAYYREHFGLSPEEARQRVASAPEGHLQHILDCPPDQLTWQDLNDLAERDPAQALRRWEELTEAARHEIRTGHRAARALVASILIGEFQGVGITRLHTKEGDDTVRYNAQGTAPVSSLPARPLDPNVAVVRAVDTHLRRPLLLVAQQDEQRLRLVRDANKCTLTRRGLVGHYSHPAPRTGRPMSVAGVEPHLTAWRSPRRGSAAMGPTAG